jgi:hypothetical protein
MFGLVILPRRIRPITQDRIPTYLASMKKSSKPRANRTARRGQGTAGSGKKATPHLTTSAPTTPTAGELPVPTRSQAAHILSDVSHDRAFYFYIARDAPTGISAIGLAQFLEKLGTIDLRSIEFHLPRGDFENWILMLGDERLAQRLSRLRETEGTPGEELRSRLSETIGARYQQLAKAQSGEAERKEERPPGAAPDAT